MHAVVWLHAQCLDPSPCDCASLFIDKDFLEILSLVMLYIYSLIQVRNDLAEV